MKTIIDPARKMLRCETLAGDLEWAFEHLVLAFGNRARLDLLPGLAEHGLALKTIGDALHIRNTVLRRIARIEIESDPAIRARLGHFVVIGGGFSGVEVAGELVDCLAHIRRYYPLVKVGEDVFGIPLWGLPAWLVWRAYYLAQMPTFGRKLRIFVEWGWGMLFPNDITDLRFTRSQDLDDAIESTNVVAARKASVAAD